MATQDDSSTPEGGTRHHEPSSDNQRESYEVCLLKGACGFGIYFTASADGAAIVDPSKPFYRLPNNSFAPGEASEVIAPTDRLLEINDMDVENWCFQDVVEELRRTPHGANSLRFERGRQRETPARPAEAAGNQNEIALSGDTNQQAKRVRWRLFDWQAAQPTAPANGSPHEDAMNRLAVMEELLVDMENQILALEQDVEREKKCRFLAEKKNILYRNALTTISDENSQLRHALAIERRAHGATQAFQQRLFLGI